ncbi:hypothetical protein U732_255 [Clostridium argentinense CDC 2741]|uniref:Uncharacterized protein n=1 Tax=Clostridium argentinense CDC 2741 TaxID=1418104 RepID=A0A0C1TZC5_9CLOT|nr:hypothetical protein [Clostridium argentinense]KIE44628.1 hypothetical protein U732_255 [Clostridium argentinense CDC 2741]
MFDYMMSITGDIKINENMSSIFIFNILSDSSNNAKREFFYIDDIIHTQFAIHSNEIGIICCLGDSQAIQYRFKEYFKPFCDIKLHKIQFRQLIAEVFYTRTLLKNDNSIIYLPNEIVQGPPWIDSYKEYNYKNYAYVLLYLLKEFGFEFKDLYSEEYDAVLDLLIDSDKRIILYDEDGRYSLGEKHTYSNIEVFKNVHFNIEKEY